MPLLGRLQELPALQLALQVATPPPPAFPYRPAALEADASAKPGSAAAAAPGAAALAACGLLVRAPPLHSGVTCALPPFVGARLSLCSEGQLKRGQLRVRTWRGMRMSAPYRLV